MREELEKVVEAYERYAQLRREYEQDPEHPPLYFAEMADYERCVQLIGLCYLLHRRDLLPRIAKLQDPIYSGTDTLYEDLLSYELEGRYDIDEWYHDKPYRDLINSFYRDTDAESLADLQAYCDAWYPAMQDCPWHDGHLRMTDTDGDYFGYWAFEAGAVAYLLDLDDSGIDSIVYPKDLVAYARRLRDEGAPKMGQAQQGRLRGEPNEIVPRAGWWHSPAKPGGRHEHWFEAGQRFPDIHTTDYGSVIWYFDPDRQRQE